MPQTKSGVALILTVGIISVLAILALGLSLSNRLELLAAENALNGLRAYYIAEAGLAYAIRELKYGVDGAQQSPYDTVRQSTYYRGDHAGAQVSVPLTEATHPSLDNLNGILGDGISGVFGDGTYRLKIIDAAARIPINAPLPDVAAEHSFKLLLRGVGLSSSQADNLVAFRRTLPGGVFSSLEEVKLVSGIATIDAWKEYFTLHGHMDGGSGHSNRVWINVNTAPAPVLRAVIAPMIAPASADLLVDRIIARRNDNPFDGSDPDAAVTNFVSARGEFNAFLTHLRSAGVITSDAALSALLQQTDPNRAQTNTTPLGFDAGGWYDIEIEGAYRNARRTIRQSVLIYEKIYETSKDEFADCDPTTARVTWKDSCPVNFESLEAWETDPHVIAGAQLIPDAIKLGFWDDFSEDYDESGTQAGDWIALQDRFEINAGGSGMLRTWPAGGFTAGVDYFPEIELDPAKWQFTEFSLRARVIDETSLSKTGLRNDLPWPAVPLGPWWQNSAPAPTAANCPDIADGTVTAATMFIKSWHSHERFLNVSHVKFGRGAVYCSFPQTTDINTGTIDLYGNWVNYDGTGYIFFAPPPDIKPFDVVNRPNIMVFCNDWIWWAWWGWHMPIDGTLTYELPNYRTDRSLCFTVRGGLYYYDPYGVYNSGQVHVFVYNADGSTEFVATEALMDYAGRTIRVTGMGTLFDLDNVRIIPRQGVYTSKELAPGAGPVEWGTITAGVSLPAGAQQNTERVFVTTTFSAGENLGVTPGTDALPPASAVPPAGGSITSQTAAALRYRVYVYSDYLVSTFNTEYKRMPVVEDVTLTYLPHTRVLGRSIP